MLVIILKNASKNCWFYDQRGLLPRGMGLQLSVDRKKYMGEKRWGEVGWGGWAPKGGATQKEGRGVGRGGGLGPRRRGRRTYE